MLSRLPIDMTDGKIAMDVGMVGTSLVVKYSDNSLQYLNLDKVVAYASGKPDFYFDMEHRVSVLEKGKTVQDNITIVPVAGFTAKVTFSAVDVPTGINISFAPPTTDTTTVVTIRCDTSTKVGQYVIGIRGTAVGGLVREFDLVMTVAHTGSGFSVNTLPTTPVDGQPAVLSTSYTTQNGQTVPAGTPLMYMQHTGWQPNPSYKGKYGDWKVVRNNTSAGLTTQHHINILHGTPTQLAATPNSFANRSRPQSNRHAKNRRAAG